MWAIPRNYPEIASQRAKPPGGAQGGDKCRFHPRAYPRIDASPRALPAPLSSAHERLWRCSRARHRATQVQDCSSHEAGPDGQAAPHEGPRRIGAIKAQRICAIAHTVTPAVSLLTINYFRKSGSASKMCVIIEGFGGNAEGSVEQINKCFPTKKS